MQAAPERCARLEAGVPSGAVFIDAASLAIRRGYYFMLAVTIADCLQGRAALPTQLLLIEFHRYLFCTGAQPGNKRFQHLALLGKVCQRG